MNITSPDKCLRPLEKEVERRDKIDRLRKEVEKGFESPPSRWTRRDAEQLRILVPERANKAHEG